ncbi:hypothetical protein HYC85_014340 [Camellia sinensis]|uniref:Uncharacterized protein n=1 Tax=Camellia sinensis TaxID=4442 RepID=A0A7J7H5Y0_CAMSI|nr:hypothetical protein HYC85_014340 [Camellia sinensis]
MKAQIYSLDSRILEMQSTISSLKDEQRTMESSLEEKQNEIKLLQEKEIETGKEDPQVIALTETLKQKEAEIEGLKRRLEYPIKVWSVSTDDPSNPAVNLTETASMTWRDKNEEGGMKEVSGGFHESTRYRAFENSSRGVDESLNEYTAYRDGDGSTRHEDRREDSVGFADTGETTGEHSQKLENSEKSANEDSRDGLGIKEETNNANVTEAIVSHGDVLKTKSEDGDTEVMDGKEHGLVQIEERENLDSQGGENQQLGMNSRGGIKMEMPDDLQAGAGYRARGKHGYASKPKEKRWRILARKRRNEGSMNAENEEDVSKRSRRFHKDALQNERYKRLRDNELQKLDRRRGNHSWKNVGINSLKPQNSEDVENESGNGRNTDTNQQIENEQEMVVPDDVRTNRTVDSEANENQQIEKAQEVVVPDDMRMNKTVDSEANETAGDASEKKSDELGQSEEHAGGVKQVETRDGDRVDQNSEKVKVAETQEAETDLRESRPKLEENREESWEETDETDSGYRNRYATVFTPRNCNGATATVTATATIITRSKCCIKIQRGRREEIFTSGASEAAALDKGRGLS